MHPYYYVAHRQQQHLIHCDLCQKLCTTTVRHRENATDICEACLTACQEALAQYKATSEKSETATEAAQETSRPATAAKLTPYQNEAITDVLCRLVEKGGRYELTETRRALVHECLAISAETADAVPNSPNTSQ